eukprot:scaffold82829_cov60-Phaeocystis_antarctica.AAC.1
MDHTQHAHQAAHAHCPCTPCSRAAPQARTAARACATGLDPARPRAAPRARVGERDGECVTAAPRAAARERLWRAAAPACWRLSRLGRPAAAAAGRGGGGGARPRSTPHTATPCAQAATPGAQAATLCAQAATLCTPGGGARPRPAARLAAHPAPERVRCGRRAAIWPGQQRLAGLRCRARYLPRPPRHR